jgi:hypothetical protein
VMKSNFLGSSHHGVMPHVRSSNPLDVTTGTWCVGAMLYVGRKSNAVVISCLMSNEVNSSSRVIASEYREHMAANAKVGVSVFVGVFALNDGSRCRREVEREWLPDTK